jgi:hypothetical protein
MAVNFWRQLIACDSFSDGKLGAKFGKIAVCAAFVGASSCPVGQLYYLA